MRTIRPVIRNILTELDRKPDRQWHHACPDGVNIVQIVRSIFPYETIPYASKTGTPRQQSAISIVPRGSWEMAVIGSFAFIIVNFKPLATNYISNEREKNKFSFDI